MILSWLMHLIGVCGDHTVRERDDKGILWLRCAGCDRRVPAIQRTAAELKKMRAKFRPVLARKATKAPSTVTPFAKGKR